MDCGFVAQQTADLWFIAVNIFVKIVLNGRTGFTVLQVKAGGSNVPHLLLSNERGQHEATGEAKDIIYTGPW